MTDSFDAYEHHDSGRTIVLRSDRESPREVLAALAEIVVPLTAEIVTADRIVTQIVHPDLGEAVPYWMYVENEREVGLFDIARVERCDWAELWIQTVRVRLFRPELARSIRVRATERPGEVHTFVVHDGWVSGRTAAMRRAVMKPPITLRFMREGLDAHIGLHWSLWTTPGPEKDALEAAIARLRSWSREDYG